METHTTHSSRTPRSSARRAGALLMAALTAFLLLATLAPGADAQTRSGRSGEVLAATEGCPDGFVEGRFGCVPENYTSEPKPEYVEVELIEFDTGCPDGWVPSPAPGGCSPGYLTLKVVGLDFDNGCPENWVPSSAPGGCSPGHLTLKRSGIEFDNGCPDKWVPSSAPGGCSPGFITIDTGRQIFEAQHHCAFGAACDDMIEAIKALGGECTETVFGDTCTLPTGPDGRD